MLRELSSQTPAFAAFTAALEAAGLPTEDLHSAPFRYFSLEDAAWGGFGPGPDGLLRSVVVAPNARGQGKGATLVEALAHRARDEGGERLWLLTSDAAPFFARLGWEHAERSVAPPAIAESRQFSTLCPTSATLMVRIL